MRLERLSAAEASRLGGPAGLAKHLRLLVPAPETVEEDVREIIEAVRVGGDEAVLRYTRRFDTGDSQPRGLTVAAQELDDALKRLPLELVAGLQVTIANVAEVAYASASEEASAGRWRAPATRAEIHTASVKGLRPESSSQRS